MAYYTDNQNYSLSERTLAAAAHLLERAAARHAHRRVYKDSLAELQKLSNRDLEDLGFHRSALKEVAREAANQKVAL